MVDHSDRFSTDRIRSWARNKAHASIYNPFAANDPLPVIPLSSVQPSGKTLDPTARDASTTSHHGDASKEKVRHDGAVIDVAPAPAAQPGPAAAPVDAPPGASTAIDDGDDGDEPKPNVGVRFYRTTRMILFSSWLNLLLVFVPVGIAVKLAHASPTIVFAINAIAIIPLAALLSYATESVARRMGDTVGALMNVTFGNAVELIIL